MQIVHDVRSFANEHAPILLTGDKPDETMMQRLTADAVWACTTVTPAWTHAHYIEHVPKLTDLRRNAMMETMGTLNNLMWRWGTQNLVLTRMDLERTRGAIGRKASTLKSGSRQSTSISSDV